MKKTEKNVTAAVETTEVTPTTGEAVETTPEVIVIPADFKMRPGRPVDPTSKRQADEAAKQEHRLAIYKAKLKAEGATQEEIDAVKELPEDFKLKQGRPVVPGSERQQKLAKGSVGNGKQGRPTNLNSERQKKLAQQMENRTRAYLAQLGITDPSKVVVRLETPDEKVFSEEMEEMAEA